MTSAIHYQLLTETQARLKLITWPAVVDPTLRTELALDTDNSIVVVKLPLERVYKRPDSPVSLPCILVTPQRVSAQDTAGTTERDDYVRPVLVTMAMADNAEPSLQLNLDAMMLWEEHVMHAFHNQRLANVAECMICHVQPAEAIIPIAWGHNVLASAVQLNFLCREPRGVV